MHTTMYSQYLTFSLLLSLTIIYNKILMYVCMMSFVEISPCRIRKLMTTSLTLVVFLRWTGHGRRGSWPSRSNPELQSSKLHRYRRCTLLGNYLAFVKHCENDIYIIYIHVFLNDHDTCPCVLKIYLKIVIYFLFSYKCDF